MIEQNEVLSWLQILFSAASDAASRKLANANLEAFQRKPVAWVVCGQLLNNQIQPLDARLFAAQTFRQKIEFDLLQLPNQANADLQLSLIQLLKQQNITKMIRTQLCLALVDLALQMDSWLDPVSQMVTDFAAPYLRPVLLEFLSLLPEELYGNRKIGLQDSSIARAEAFLKANSANVLALLLSYLQQARTFSSNHRRY
jgi:transportin-3